MENKKPTQEEIQSKVNEFLSKLDGKDFNIYFYCTDTRGNALASVSQIYEHVKILTNLGYKAHILCDNEKYTPVETWLGKEYAELSHIMLSNNGEPIDIKITSADFLIVPEVYANIMQQVSKLPCKKIVLCQNYTFISEILPLDKTWSLFGFDDVITTSPELSGLVKEMFPSVKAHEIPILFNGELFSKPEKPQKPYISFVTKDQSDFRVITNLFYRKYPLFRWFTPRDLRGLSTTEFSDALKESCVLVWVDKRSTYGTAPIEAMKCGVPVIGIIPEMIPNWMKEETENGLGLSANGVWVGSLLEIPDVLNDICQAYLEDIIPTEITNSMEDTIKAFDCVKDVKTIEKMYSNIFETRKEEITKLGKQSTEEDNKEE